MNEYSQYAPFFEQDDPEATITGMIAQDDLSQPYELDAVAVFKADKGYLVVFVSGCSCWPDRGSTTQVYCRTKTEVDKQLGERRHDLLDKCQSLGWKVQKGAK